LAKAQARIAANEGRAAVVSGGESVSVNVTINMKMLQRATLVGETTAGRRHSGAFHRINDHFGMGIQEAANGRPVTCAVSMLRRRYQFSVGLSTRSTTSTSIVPFVSSSFRPSCSCSAVGSDGAFGSMAGAF
jgi:hypothetical protein